MPASPNDPAREDDRSRNPLVEPDHLESRNPHDRSRINRRSLIVATTATGVAATTAAIPGIRAQESTPSAPDTPEEAATQVATVTGHDPEETAATAPVAGGYKWLQPFHIGILEAATDRLIPSDDLGPGAVEAGVVYFIDNQLYQERFAGRGYRGPRYDQGPFTPGEVTQGDQSALPMAERFRLGILGMEAVARSRFGNSFVNLTGEQQDEILADMEAGLPEHFGPSALTEPPATFDRAATSPAVAIGAKAFFDLLLAYTVAGFFSDPVHGGNRDMIGWKLIGFPGAQMGYPDWILRYGEPFEGEYLSLADHQNVMSREGA
jgi:gluconate 2-dehydrogenase gamma chain